MVLSIMSFEVLMIQSHFHKPEYSRGSTKINVIFSVATVATGKRNLSVHLSMARNTETSFHSNRLLRP